MKFIIKEWPDKSATLMTGNGYSLATFDTSMEAQRACDEWHKIHREQRDVEWEPSMTEAIHA